MRPPTEDKGALQDVARKTDATLFRYGETTSTSPSARLVAQFHV